MNLFISVDTSSFVYIIKGYGRWYKIGVSREPKNRLKQLQTACPFKLEIVKTISTHKATTLEMDIHERFIDRRGEGEWFRLTESDLKELDVFVSSFKEYPIVNYI